MRFRTLFSTAALAVAALHAQALELRPFSNEALAQAQAKNQPVAVHFHADWCPTCRAQEKVLQSLQSDKALDLTVLVANYDTEKELKKHMKVRAQSTLVVLRGGKETARVVGDTDAGALRQALQSAL